MKAARGFSLGEWGERLEGGRTKDGHRGPSFEKKKIKGRGSNKKDTRENRKRVLIVG